jgi:hypothetical protein
MLITMLIPPNNLKLAAPKRHQGLRSIVF